MNNGPDQTRIQDLLEKQGIQATAQRMLIAELLFARDQHLTAEQIIQTLAERGTDVSKATVYNTLNLFAPRAS
jgi:Fur family iron response transcriptional regulator